MDDFEKRLKQLPLRRPSDELDRKVLETAAMARRGPARVEDLTPPLKGRWTRPRVPLWAAIAASIALAAVGFAGGALLFAHKNAPADVATAPPVIHMQVIYNQEAPRPLDATRASQDFLPEPMKVKVQVEGGV